MTDMTATQQSDIRADLAIADAAQTPFSDAEFNRLYTRAGADYNYTVVLAIRQLLVDSAKRNSYRTGQTAEETEQIFENLMKLAVYWQDVVAQGGRQVGMTGALPVPPRPREVPYGGQYPSPYAPGGYPFWWWR